MAFTSGLFRITHGNSPCENFVPIQKASDSELPIPNSHFRNCSSSFTSLHVIRREGTCLPKQASFNLSGVAEQYSCTEKRLMAIRSKRTCKTSKTAVFSPMWGRLRAHSQWHCIAFTGIVHDMIAKQDKIQRLSNKTKADTNKESDHNALSKRHYSNFLYSISWEIRID